MIRRAERPSKRGIWSPLPHLLLPPASGGGDCQRDFHGGAGDRAIGAGTASRVAARGRDHGWGEVHFSAVSSPPVSCRAISTAGARRALIMSAESPTSCSCLPQKKAPQSAHDACDGSSACGVGNIAFRIGRLGGRGRGEGGGGYARSRGLTAPLAHCSIAPLPPVPLRGGAPCYGSTHAPRRRRPTPSAAFCDGPLTDKRSPSHVPNHDREDPAKDPARRAGEPLPGAVWGGRRAGPRN
jgi:hypothetical protein